MARKKADLLKAPEKAASRSDPAKTGRATPKKRSVETYDHKSAKRLNNPPVGLVNPESDKLDQPKTYRFDPHADPALNFDRDGAIERALDEQIKALQTSLDTLEGLATGGVGSLPTQAAPPEAIARAREALSKLKAMRAPYLNWAGKAEHTSFEVPTVSLHVHERIEPRRIIQEVRRRNGTPKQPSLFEQKEENPPLSQAIDFYGHRHGWSNRLIAGDSLLVMNSLLQKEGMAGKVQMVYFDPPYGIKYGSNFQPFTNKRDVKDGKDEDLTQEPEMIRAFRDTWELGIHSYLAYLKDRLVLARDLLTDSGSLFLQISDENVHHCREILDEVFRKENFMGSVVFAKTTSSSSDSLSSTFDYLLWYAKDRGQVKYRQIHKEKLLGGEGGSAYGKVELPTGEKRALNLSEREDPTQLPAGARIYRLDNLTSQRPLGEGDLSSFSFEGKKYRPKGTFKTDLEGLRRLAAANRLEATPRGGIYYRRFLRDFPVFPLSNLWTDTVIAGFVSDKNYVVETSAKVVARCLLMTTDPGDLVFDPTCGSGTTAYVAEQWGRRWMTCDTSRVAVTLAKQRLMSADFDFYELAEPSRGVSGGILCKTVPHVTLKSIANNPEIREGLTRAQIDAAIAKYADQETLYDQPIIDKGKVRVTGPFTVEAVPPAVGVPEIISPGAVTHTPKVADLSGKATLPGFEDAEGKNRIGFGASSGNAAGSAAQHDQGQRAAGVPRLDASIGRSGETRRQAEWRAELLAAGVRAKGGQKIQFSRVEPMPGMRFIHADAETSGNNPERAVISFGPEHGPVDNRQVEEAVQEAWGLMPRPKMLIFAGFQFDPDAASDIDKMTPEKMKFSVLKVQMNTDLLTSDLKKARSSNESFWLIGQPDVLVRRINHGEDTGKYEAEVFGFDYYDPRKGEVRSGVVDQIAMWMLDTTYDGRSVYPSQVFFPMADEKSGWARLARSLKQEIDADLIQAYHGSVSLPFEAKIGQKIAIKIIDDRGIESIVVKEVAR